jgi:hypothetical protein
MLIVTVVADSTSKVTVVSESFSMAEEGKL